ncbi:MAG: Hsp70 family protein, partial [Candidatus Thorarchaeota archaeon]
REAIIDAKNTADQMIYQGEKLLKDFEDKVPDNLKENLKKESESLKKAIEEEDLEKMKSGTESVKEIIYEISQKVYGGGGPGAQGFDPSQMGAAGFDPSQMGAQGRAGTGASSSEDDIDEDSVVDVDFEDIDED